MLSLENQGTVKLNVCPFAEVSEKHLSFTRISFTKNPNAISKSHLCKFNKLEFENSRNFMFMLNMY